jgi:hypothetical protein
VIRSELKSGKNMFNLDRAVRYALSTAVKFQNNPKKSLALVKILTDSPSTPFYLKQNALAWLDAIHNWMKEKPGKLKTNLQILNRSRELVKKGQQLQATSDRAGDVYFMRALSDLHALMTRDLKKSEQGEVLYLIGVSYESVHDLSVWSLHENYYESCVRRVPHTKWSSKCYRRLEESVYLGFTGSSGVRVPQDALEKLHELQLLALPQ